MDYEYFSPNVNIQIGEYNIQNNIILELRLDKENNFNWAKIKFTTKFLETLNTQKDDRVSINLGYNSSLNEVFVGNVTGVKKDEVIARDDFIKLNKKKILHTFKKCTPQEVISFVLNQCGVSDMKLSNENYSIRDLLSIKNLTAFETLKYVDLKWDIKNSTYLFDKEIFKWNVPHEQDNIYTFEYGENIIDLQNISPKIWDVYTISLPQIKVFDKIQIQHPNITGLYKTNAVTFYVNDYGFIRTKITFSQ